MKVLIADLGVDGSGMMFGKVVSKIVGSGFPIDLEPKLTDSVPEPIKSHVDGLGSSLFYCRVHNAMNAFVIGLDGSCRLLMTKVKQYLA
jgi:hypothetical protein